MIIYKATNLQNRKVYIGQTKSSLEQRRKCHENPKVLSYLHYAIRKYGKGNFHWEMIEECNSIEELNKREKYWIIFYESNNSKCGYNLTTGGDNFERSQSTKDRMSQVAKKRFSVPENNTFFGKHHSKSTKQRISTILSRKFSKKGNPFYGKKHSEESKEKISEANNGKKRSLEYRSHLSENTKGERNSFYGKKHSEESKGKMSKAKMGTSWGRHSIQSIQKLSEAKAGKNNPFFGKHLSSKHKSNISNNLVGRKFSEETKLKMSLAAKKRWEK